MIDKPQHETVSAPRVGLLAFDAAGHPMSPMYGDVYKPREGAVAEAREVFVNGCRLLERWADAPAFVVLELGLGLGVNLLATLAAWREDPRRPTRLHIVSVEAHLLPVDALRRAHAAIGLQGPDADALVDQWPMPLPGLHRLRFADGAVTLTVAIGDAAHLVPKLALAADAFFLDGFAPACNPAMWSHALMKALARLARPGATASSCAVEPSVHDALVAAGFVVRDAPGLAARHARIAATYAPRWRTYPAPPPRPLWSAREALVIGAGIAGCHIAQALSARGWHVTLLERNAHPLREGSAQPALADHLHVSPDDNLLARLSRAALLLRRAGGTRSGLGHGKLQLASDPQEAQRQRALVASLGFPESFLRALDREEASDLAGVRLAQDALWLPMCDSGPAFPGGLDALEALPGVDLRFNLQVSALQRQDAVWHARDAQGVTVARAPVVVLANAGDAVRLAGLRGVGLRRVRGQTTVLPPGALPGLRAVLGGPAYVCPLNDGQVLVGSTFDDLDDLNPDAEADLSNLRRLQRMLADDAMPGSEVLRGARGVVGFRHAAHDRMPLIGALPDQTAVHAQAAELRRNDRLALPVLPGLFGAFGFGSRGRLWARLGAEVIADLLEGDPAMLERDLLAAIAPHRMLRQAVRTGRIR